jgi:hypothetical protein
MTVNGTMGMGNPIQPDWADAAPKSRSALQLAQARTTLAVSTTPKTTSGGNIIRVSHCLTNLEDRFIEDIIVISL